MINQTLQFILVLLISWVSTNVLWGQDLPSKEDKSYQTDRLKGAAPKIDGYLDDACWANVEWAGDFIESQPNDGAKASQKTLFKILYDDKNIYLAFKCLDTSPDSIVSRMSRRDGFDGDWVEINIDSYHDLRTAFSFTTSVSGVKGDEFISEDGNNWDESWNPIWYTKTSINEEGWIAESAIPLSQLRFSQEEIQTWGLQVTRRDFRNDARSRWQYIQRNAGVFVSAFGKLEGIKGIKPKKQLELQPYVLGKLDLIEKEPGHPFRSKNLTNINAGLDGKIGITNDLTLDFTVNPDFGQVEADPSALTLDGFQIFFNERRPFFIENRNIFNYQITESEAFGPFTSDLLFYSRRLGASPSRFVSGDPSINRYVDRPDFTNIIGAAKFSGKTKNGLSIGLLESVTAKEYAEVSINGESSTELVEPLTNYFVSRFRQDINKGNTIVGGIFTAVNRKLDDPSLMFLPDQAYTGGLDFLHQWNNKKWRITGKLIFSQLQGSRESITRKQTAFEHNFDRPGADHVSVDTNATELGGTGGTFIIGKYGDRFNFQTGATWRSPGLELNDIGFMINADEINHFAWAGYRWIKPFSIFRNLGVNYNHWSRWDFGGQNLYRAINFNGWAQFKNFWNGNLSFTHENLDLSNNHLRGGPTFKKPSGLGYNLWFGTDGRKKIRFNAGTFTGIGFEKVVRFRNFNAGVTYRPTNALNIFIGPGYSQNFREDQWVRNIPFNGETKYVVGEVDQRTFNLTARINYNISPDLTIQYYGQPFVSKGTYTDFKYVTDPLGEKFADRIHRFTDNEMTVENGGNTIMIDENQDGVTDYSFDRPDFSFFQFRSNLVVRWEYIPGSEVYFVWSQGATGSGDPQDQVFKTLGDNLFSEKIQNTFLVKFAYRWRR